MTRPGLGLNDKTGKCSTGKEKDPKATDQKEPEALEKAEEFGDNTELEEKIDQLSERREDGLWVCNRCGKTDKLRWVLKYPTFLVPFENPIFSRFHLRRHVETHIEGCSHSCGVCGKSFTQRAALKAHMWREQHKIQ